MENTIWVHSGLVISTHASLQEGNGSSSSWPIFMWSLHVFVHLLIFSRHFDFLPQSDSLIKDSKLSIQVNVSVWDCCSLYGLAMDEWNVQGVPHFWSRGSCNQASLENGWLDGWMNPISVLNSSTAFKDQWSAIPSYFGYGLTRIHRDAVESFCLDRAQLEDLFNSTVEWKQWPLVFIKL